jgi:ferrous iron transport protein B
MTPFAQSACPQGTTNATPCQTEGCHAPLVDPWSAVQSVVLAGNPNVGKSVVFNALTGQYANVSNFPGTTVDLATGTLKANPNIQIKDTPGVYGLSQLSEEENVAETIMATADVVINVVSALSLERDLFFTQQLLDWGYRVVVAVNQCDEAEARQLPLNLPVLAQQLGVPVVPTVAVTGQGIQALIAAIPQASLGNPTPDSPAALALRVQEQNPGQRLLIYGHRRQHVNTLLAAMHQACVPSTGVVSVGQRVASAMGRALLHPVVGTLVGLLVMAILYQVIGVWVAGDLVNITEKTVMLQWVVPWLKTGIATIVPTSSLLFTVLAGEFGVVTMSIQYIFGVLFPLVLGFYVYMAILEDCGYLPRIAVLADGLLNRVGLNGRAVIPLILGFGCVTMATVATRSLTSQRERTIASTLLAITIPCSAQIGVIMGLMALAGGLKAWVLYACILTGMLLLIGGLLNKVLPGRSSSLILDLPPMRMPRLGNIATKTWVRTKSFLIEAAPLFVLGSLIVSVVQAFGWLGIIQQWLAPVTVQWLLLPAAAANAFIMGMVRRDFGAAGMYFLAPHMSPAQLLTSLLVITLFVPCIASATVMTKERGVKEGVVVLVASWLIAFAAGGVFARVLGVLL